MLFAQQSRIFQCVRVSRFDSSLFLFGQKASPKMRPEIFAYLEQQLVNFHCSLLSLISRSRKNIDNSVIH